MVWHIALGFLAGGACTSAPARMLPAGETMLTVRAPRSADGDPASVLVDHAVGGGAWHCSAARAPLRYELMFADGLPRRVRAVGVVASNLGPDGLGPIEVRVQTGHGVAARGETYHARARPRNEQMVVFELPEPVRGDHVLLALLRRSAFSTARCLGEILVFDEASPAPADALRIPLIPGRQEESTADGAVVPGDAAAEADVLPGDREPAGRGDAGDADAETHTGNAVDADVDGGLTDR